MPPASTCQGCRRGAEAGGMRRRLAGLLCARLTRACKALRRTQLPAMPLLICFALAVLAAAGIAAWPLWVRLRRERIAGRPFPQPWRRILRRRVPLAARLPARQQLKLKALMQVFLAEKPIIGCRGLRVTDEI